MTVTVDGGVFEALLSNMIPGKMYQVTVSSVKGLEESDPSTDTVTTGQLSSSPCTTLIPSVFSPPVESVRGKLNWSLPSWRRVPVCALKLWTDLRVWLQSMSRTPQPCCCGNRLWPLSMATSLHTAQIRVRLHMFSFICVTLWFTQEAELGHLLKVIFRCVRVWENNFDRLVWFIDACLLTVSPMVKHVSGNVVEFEMGSLVPGTHYTVGVHAMKEALKSDSAVTEFTTGTLREKTMKQLSF